MLDPYFALKRIKNKSIQDFPLRGKFVYLHIKRRPWTNKDTGEIVKRDWDLVTKGPDRADLAPQR